MKKALAIILTIICGFAANFLIWLGAAFVGLMTNLSLIFLIVAILLIIAASALLNLVRNKCKDKLTFTERRSFSARSSRGSFTRLLVL